MKGSVKLYSISSFKYSEYYSSINNKAHRELRVVSLDMLLLFSIKPYLIMLFLNFSEKLDVYKKSQQC